MDRVPTFDAGILGVVLSDPEVIAVFPEMSSTALPHSQEIRLFRGDSLDIAVQLQNDLEPPDPVSMENSLLRWVAKQSAAGVPTSLINRVMLGNEYALVVKSSSDPLQIEMVAGTQGRAVIYLNPDDTRDLPAGRWLWDLEITKSRSFVELPPGNVLMSSGANQIMSLTPSLDWTTLGIRSGDLVHAQGKTVRVSQVVTSQHILVDHAQWQTGMLPSATHPSENTFSVSRSRTKTVAFGSFVVLLDVTR